MSIIRTAAAIATISFAVPHTAAAQPLGKIVVTPYVGVFAPNNEAAKSKLVESAPGRPIVLERGNGLAIGATGAYWFAPRRSVEVGAVYAWSDLRSTFALSEAGQPRARYYDSRNGGQFLGAAKLMLGLFPAPSGFQLRLGVGPAVIAHIGSAYGSDVNGVVSPRTNIGAAVSLCTKVPLAERLALRLRVEDYMYQSRLRWKDAGNPAATYTFDRRLQHDFVLSTGLQIGLMR